ncbi:MAG: enoyl-CoA hydratase [Pelagerythrobacter marensis]|nr:MAG: enoyl-CoA hydratase [Pelagerythrobacter marensis]
MRWHPPRFLPSPRRTTKFDQRQFRPSPAPRCGLARVTLRDPRPFRRKAACTPRRHPADGRTATTPHEQLRGRHRWKTARSSTATPIWWSSTTTRRALAQAAAEPRIGAVVLTGAEGFFCAGGDLNLLMTAQTMSEDERRARIEDLADLIRAILDCPRPVIAAVEGGAAGAGFSLALACDLIIAAEDARFSASYVNAGLVPDGGLTGSLLGAVPPALAAELCLGGQPVLAAAEGAAAQLARGPADSQASIKRLIAGGRRQLLDRQLEAEVAPMATALASAEAAEGIAAFLGKRAPDFAALRRRG